MMSSKISSQIGIIVKAGIISLSLTLFSCSDFLKGKPKTDDYITIQSDGKLDCLNSVSTDLSHFFNSEAGGEVLDKTLLCIDTTLTEFQNKVEGTQDANSFTADDIYNIFRVFVSSANLSREAAANIIQLKAALIGGDTTRITKAEINGIKRYLVVVKDEAKKLAPYIAIYGFKATDRVYSEEQIRQAFSAMGAGLKRLLDESQLANSNYSFSDFKNMLINVLNLNGESQSMVTILTKVNYVLNGYQAELSYDERLMYINSLCEFLRLYSMHRNNYVKIDFKNIYELDSTVDFLNDIIDLLQNSLQYKKTYLISANSLDHLMLAVSESGILSHNVRASSLINFYKIILVRMFESGINGNIQYFTGIKPINFLNLRREVAVYQIYSRLLKKIIPTAPFRINSETAPDPVYNIRELQRVMGELSINQETDILSRFDANNAALILAGVAEMRDDFIAPNPALFRENKIIMDYNESALGQSIGDLARGLYIRMMSRLIMLGYGQQASVLNINQNTITDVGMYLWYGDFKAFSIDIKAFDPRLFNGGTSFVKVANLFTRDGGGDKTMSFRELHENLGVLLTSGTPLLTLMYADMDAARCELLEKDVFGRYWNQEACFMAVLKNNYRRYFSHLPQLVMYLDGLDDTRFKMYIYELLNIARYSQATAGLRVEQSDLTTLNSMLYYIESIYALHDSDANRVLSEAEIRAAYPKFQGVATEFAETTSKQQLDDFKSIKGDAAGFGCFSREDLIRESFIFLAFHGRTPQLGDMNSFPCFTGKPLFYFSGQVDRQGIVSVFKSLKNVLAPTN